MWEIRNETRFAAAGGVVVDKNGEEHWAVVVKGTFDIQPDGNLRVADDQVEPKVAPEYRGDPASSSLVYDQDIIGAKPRTDVYLNAKAYAPGGEPTTKVVVGLQNPLGDKPLVARGDRVWGQSLLGLVPSGPEPFVEMPIIYERAYGGYDHEDVKVKKHRMSVFNPVGTGVFSRRSRRRGKLMPNIEHKGTKLTKHAAGYGALCSHWQSRARYQGTYDTEWMKKRRPLLPEDYNPLALQCAPADQQFHPHLRGGERFGLLNMNPNWPVLSFKLPNNRFWFATRIGPKKLDQRATMDTVVIEPDYPRVIVVWRSILSCHRLIDDIDFTVIGEKRRV